MTEARARRGPDIALVRDGLAARLQELARTLAPGKAERRGHDLWLVNPARADRHPGSFKVDISGPYAGRWFDFADNVGGDAIDLIAYLRGYRNDCKSRAARAAAIKWAIDWLGLQGASPASLRAAEKRAAAARTAHARAAKVADAAKHRRAAVARADWLAAPVSAWRHDVSRRYLLKVRGIVPQLLKCPGGGLRLEPFGARSRGGSKIDPQSGRPWPAMIAPLIRAGQVVAAHRTYLTHDGSAKAPVGGGGRRMFGSPAGAAIRLTRGGHDCSPEKAVRDGLGGEMLALSEGIEDGLIWAMLHPDHRVWAASTVGLIGKVDVPACVASIVIAGQNDAPGSAAAAALQRAGAALAARTGKPVQIARPADKNCKDWNDLWRSKT